MPLDHHLLPVLPSEPPSPPSPSNSSAAHLLAPRNASTRPLSAMMFGRLAPSPSCSSSVDRPFPPSSPTFLRNKLAQALAILIHLEYPTLWPSPFLHLFPCLPSIDPFIIDMFARLLAALNDKLLNQDYPRSPAEAAAASRITDSMHHQRVPQITEKKIKVAGGAVLLTASPPQFTPSSHTIYSDRFIPSLFSRSAPLTITTCLAARRHLPKHRPPPSVPLPLEEKEKEKKRKEEKEKKRKEEKNKRK